MEAIRFLYAVFIILLAGSVILRFAENDDGLHSSPMVRLGVAFMIGLGALSLQMFVYSLVSIAFGIISISAPWLLIWLISYFPFFKRGGGYGFRLGTEFFPGLRAFDYFLFALILIQLAYVFVYSPMLPVTGWDAWAIWLFKGRALYEDKGVTAAFLTNASYAYDHPDYPLLLPLSVAWVHTAVGRVSASYAKLVFSLQYVSMLSVIYYVVRRSATKRFALAISALLAMTPIILIHAAGFPVNFTQLYSSDFVGYADLTLAIYFMCAAAFFYLYMVEEVGHYATVAALFLAMSAWTKNEGLPFALFGALMLICVSAVKRLNPARTAIIVCLILALFIAPWLAYKVLHHIGSEYTGNLSMEVIGRNSGRAALVVSSVIGYMFVKVSFFSLAWWMYVAAAILSWRSFLRPRTLLLHAMLMAQLSVYVFIYIITPSDINWHLGTSLERLLLHLTPLSILISALNIGSWLYKKRR